MPNLTPAPALERAEWSTAFQNNLPDSSFAYIEPGGSKDKSGKTTPRSLRHLPYKDKNGKVDPAHTRNALARLESTQIPDAAKASARRKLVAAAKSVGIEVSDDKEERAMSAPATAKITSFYCPIRARDDENWEIEGVLSNEEIDTYKTGFDYDSMKAAVEDWIGNVREQHDKTRAVGKRVYAVCDDEKREVVLRARISKSEPGTWTKIEEGIYNGFSINAYDVKDVEYRQVNGTRFPFFKGFKLAEASVVDAPSNPGAARSGLTIYRAAGYAGTDEDYYGAEFEVYPDAPAPVGDTAAAAQPSSAPAPAAAALAIPAPLPTDATLREVTVQAPGANPDEDPRIQALARAKHMQAVGLARQQAQIAQMGGGDGTWNEVALPPITEADLAADAAVAAAQLTAPAPQGVPATRQEQSISSPATGTVQVGALLSSAPALLTGSVARADTNGKDAVEEAMNKDTGAQHSHDHTHAGGWSPLHFNDHSHQHQDGTTHSHPHMHNHDHHDHYGDESHGHPHVHLHDHSHEYRMSAPDISRVTCPRPEDVAQQVQAQMKVATAQVLLNRDERAALQQQLTAQAQRQQAAVPATSQERAVSPGTGLVGNDLQGPAQVVVPGASEQRAKHGPFKGKHAHAHSSFGSQGDDETHDHSHSHNYDSLHDHEHPETDESGDEEGEENAGRAVVGSQARAGARISSATMDGLHAIRDQAMQTCNCQECQDFLDAQDEEDEEEGEEGDGDGDERAVGAGSHRSTRFTRRLEHLLVTRLSRKIEQEVLAPLQTLLVQQRAVSARFTAISLPNVSQIQTQLDKQDSALAELQGLVRLIAEQEQTNGPVLRAADPKVAALTPVQKVLGLSNQAVLDASAPGGGQATVTPELIQQELAQLYAARASGQLYRQEDQIAAAAILTRQVNSF